MKHNLFGKLKYKDSDECWIGWLPLARFAAHGARNPEQPLTEEQAQQMIAEMNQAMDGMRGLLREQYGPGADEAFAEIDRQTEHELAQLDAEDDQPDPIEAERQRRRQTRAKARTERLTSGRYPVRIADAAEEGPTAQQEAAFRHLTENEPAILDAVLAEVWDSFQNAYGQEQWRQIVGLQPADNIAALHGRFALTRVEIARQHRGGLAHLIFTVDSQWQDEHGLLIVYSPDTRKAAWTSYDGLEELTESDEPDDGANDWVPTPHDELVEAVLNGDEERARQLVAAGADINALAADEYPPLCMAVDQLEVDEVQRLLVFHANPNLADPQEKQTPLKMAKRMYKEMGFGPAKKKDAMYEAMMTIAREAAGKQFDDMRTRLEAIIRLLEGAGGR